MSQPTPYSRQFDFTGWSSTRPSDQQPGTSLDAEYNALKVTIDAILANLVQLQRDDGAPKNSIVTLDTLATDVLNTIGSGQGWVPRGAWVTTHAYVVGDVVSNSGSTYVCSVAHTSGTFNTDHSAGKWVAIFGAVASGSLTDGAVTEPKIADGAVTVSKLGFTSLDLAGTFRAQGGVAAGTALAGSYTIAGQADAGSAYSSIARASKAQGKVGFRIDGGTGGKVWTWEQPAGQNYTSITYDGIECIRFDAPNGITNFLSGLVTRLYRADGTRYGEIYADNNGLNVRAQSAGDGLYLGSKDAIYFYGGSLGTNLRGLVDSNGNFIIGASSGSIHTLQKSVSEGSAIAEIRNATTTSIGISAVSGSGASGAASAMGVNKNSSTNRSINAAGTVNASGADYAEYMLKREDCGTIPPGQICGVDNNGRLTDRFDFAHSFVIKSTDPAYVGGDTWGVGLEGAALEAERIKYDRIAFSGQVPVNHMGAAPGQYIRAIRNDDGTIGAHALSAPDGGCVGKVWKILEDGRAWVAVRI